MKNDTEAACRDYVRKLDEAFAAAGRACSALGEERDLGEPDAAKAVDPRLVGQIVLGHTLALLLVERARLMAYATTMAGKPNGEFWRRAVLDEIYARCARLMEECSCGTCQSCGAREAAVQRAMEVVRQTTR